MSGDALDRLHEVVARRCRGRVLVMGDPDPGLVRRMVEAGLKTTVDGTSGTVGDGEGGPDEPLRGVSGRAFGTVVLAGAIERLDDAAGAAFIEGARARVKPGGRLIVVVPNEDCVADARRTRDFDRRGLKSVLRPLGSFRFVNEQPYRWIVAEVRPKDRRNGPRRNPSREERYRVTAELCRGRVIELGCGAGDLVARIRARGLEVVGVDLNAEKIAQARADQPGVTFLRSDIRDLDLPDGGFDTAVLAEVLEHLTEEPGAEVLARAVRLVRPRGRLVVSVPNEDAIPHPHHVRTFDRRSLEELLGPWGTAHLITEQPHKWLLMVVELKP